MSMIGRNRVGEASDLDLALHFRAKFAIGIRKFCDGHSDQRLTRSFAFNNFALASGSFQVGQRWVGRRVCAYGYQTAIYKMPHLRMGHWPAQRIGVGLTR